jgi:CBS domain-containing membrane protein
MAFDWMRGFHPAGMTAPRREALLGSAGVALSVYATEWLCRSVQGHASMGFIAPMGATAVLLFFLPASPMAQPWPVAAGNLVGAAVGVGFMQIFGASGLVAAGAVAATCLLMMALRCLNPPGVAVALSAVLGGADVKALGFGFVWWPVAANTAVLLLLAVVFNNAAGRRYPHHHAPGPADVLPAASTGIIKQDLLAALAAYGEPLDVDEDDLEAILAHAQQHAERRNAA